MYIIIMMVLRVIYNACAVTENKNTKILLRIYRTSRFVRSIIYLHKIINLHILSDFIDKY